MDKLIVTIANNSEAPLTIFGRNRICIPGSGNTRVELPDTPQTSALLTRLRREYPFLTVQTATTKESAPHAVGTHGETETDKTSALEPAKPEPVTTQEKTDSASGGKPKGTPKTETNAG